MLPIRFALCILNFHGPLLSMKDLSATLEKPGVISIPTATWTPWRWAYGFPSVAVCWLVVYSRNPLLFKGNVLKTEDWPKPESWILNHWLTQLALEVFGLPFISSLGKYIYIFRWNQRWAIIWMEASNAPWCFHDPQKRAADEIGVHLIYRRLPIFYTCFEPRALVATQIELVPKCYE